MGFNQFMTLTTYVFGIGLGIYAIRNEKQVVGFVTGIWNGGVDTARGIATIGA